MPQFADDTNLVNRYSCGKYINSLANYDLKDCPIG